MASERGNGGDLDQAFRIIELNLAAAAGGGLTGRDPGVPHRIHGREIIHAGQPDLCRQQT